MTTPVIQPNSWTCWACEACAFCGPAPTALQVVSGASIVG